MAKVCATPLQQPSYQLGAAEAELRVGAGSTARPSLEELGCGRSCPPGTTRGSHLAGAFLCRAAALVQLTLPFTGRPGNTGTGTCSPYFPSAPVGMPGFAGM